jgi:short-subunit dehydrogenase
VKNFKGTVALITGASSGIGAALALEIARQGGDVVLVARRKDRLHAVANNIELLGRRALVIQADIANDGDIDLAVKKINSEFGRIDYVVANAGFGVAGRFERLTLEDFRRQFETNVFGVLRTVFAARENLIASHGCLGIVGSINGYFATTRLSPYVMSKFAVHGLADALRHEFRPHGVGVVLIAPGMVKTEIRQVDKMGVHHPEIIDCVPSWLMITPAKAARQIANALYRRTSVKVITVHGKISVFLQRHFPGFLSALIYRMQRKGLSR